MEDFFKKITKNKASEEYGIKTYIRLIFNAHYFFLKSALSEYFKKTDERKFSNYIETYIKNAKKTRPFPITMVNDFASFIKDNTLEKRKFANELINFELAQINIFELPYDVKKNSFSWKKRYKIGINTKLIKQNYESHINPIKKRKNYIIVYKDTNYNSSYIEITKFLYDLISFKNNKNILQNLKRLCHSHQIDFKASKKALSDVLELYTQNGILETSSSYKYF